MAVTFRRRNISLLVLVLFASVMFLWGTKLTSRRKSSSAPKSLPVSVSPGPVLQQPAVGGKNKTNFVPEHSYSLDAVRKRARIMNFEQVMNNREKFGDHRADDPVIVIQAHERHNFLKLLLDSLRAVKGIEGATLVISRDKFTGEMDSVIDQNIEFCRYMEIFFPFSMQLFPDKYPGEDPNDCSRDLPKIEAQRMGCNNADFPDMYGHYREVKFVQLKHHWFWKLNMVFEGIREIKGNTGPILFLEDDNYVLPDLINIMRKADLERDANCEDCLSITLGGYDSSTDFRGLGSHTEVKSWVSSQHNIGMMLNQKFYNQLSDCAKYFCNYDDYNWDWSLQSTALKCFTKPLYTMIIKVPRVYHLGCTGFHQKHGRRCDISAEVKRLQTMVDSEYDNLFPTSLQMQSSLRTPNAPHMENGGWGDIRDRELCQTYKELCKSFSDVSR